jgi:PTS system ascorbate-specific IIA component
VISALEFEAGRHSEGVDFIISTIPLRTGHVPAVQVNPLLGQDDCRRLRGMYEARLGAMPGNGLPHPVILHLSDLLNEQRMQLGVSAASWPEVVDCAGKPLLEAGTIDRRFVAAMKDVIYENGPYMVIWPGTVLLHAHPRGVRQLSISLVNLRKPVAFGHPEHDPVYVALVLAAVDNQSHLTALQELNDMMQDPQARAAVRRTQHKSVVMHWISRYVRLD